MSKTIDFIFDFASPNAYLAHRALQPVLERTGAVLNIKPCLLGGIFKSTGNQAPMITYGSVKGKPEYERIEFSRFLKKHQLKQFHFNSHFPVNTLIMMRGAIAAEQDGMLERYVEAGLSHMWEKGLKMDDPQVYATAMSEAGFDGEDLLKRTQDQSVKDQLASTTADAVERGAFGIPTFHVGDEMFFGKDRIRDMEEYL